MLAQAVREADPREPAADEGAVPRVNRLRVIEARDRHVDETGRDGRSLRDAQPALGTVNHATSGAPLVPRHIVQ